MIGEAVQGARARLHRLREENGISLPMVALSFALLLWLAALGIDLGWFYLHAQRLQRAADASALAGVIWLPGDMGSATTAAVDVARTNGYDTSGSPPYPQVAVAQVDDTQLQVTVTDEVPTFFLKALGRDTQVIAMKATAEYIPPLRLGSDENQFGNSCNQDDAPPGVDCGDDFWANIHGKYTQVSFGDAYSPYCWSGNGNSSCSSNPTFRPRGYLYGIEKGTNSGFTVEFLDMAHHNTSGGTSTNDHHRTGDRGCEAWGDATPLCGQTVTTNLYRPSPSPFDLLPGDLLCSYTWIPRPQVPTAAPYVWEVPSPCFIQSSASAGVYRLQVVVEEPSQPQYSGLNRYSIRVPAGSKLYGLGDMSIYNNSTGGTTVFKVAEVSDIYAGKTFVVELYDAGESSDTGTLSMIDPRTGSAWTGYPAGACRIYSRNHNSATWGLQSEPGTCAESVNPGEYQNRWLKFEMDMDDTYTCTDCWWRVNYAYPSGVQDTTTWRAYVIGNPIHLIRD